MKRLRHRHQVTFSEEMNTRLKSDAQIVGKTPSQFLIDMYISKNSIRPICTHEDLITLIRELNLIGNNLNQATRLLYKTPFVGIIGTIETIQRLLIHIKFILEIKLPREEMEKVETKMEKSFSHGHR